MSNEFPVLDDPRAVESIRGVLRDISNQMTMVEGHRAAINEALKGLKEEYELPAKLLRKMARTYHKQNFSEEVNESEDFVGAFEKVFGEDEG